MELLCLIIHLSPLFPVPDEYSTLLYSPLQLNITSWGLKHFPEPNWSEFYDALQVLEAACIQKKYSNIPFKELAI